ncbi:MAG: single-stranded DNA-binding protein [Puniceicoccaceae bacterium]|nr:MAG: single-stranded DNA-binding protein [Puniceicoccaceae bacterium]
MASFNKVILMGNLTRDPELRVTSSGLSICKLGLAVSRYYTTKDGEKKEETTFVDIDAFGRQAETISKYMRKGRPIFVEGRLRLDQWESKEGEKRSKLGVVLDNFQFIGGRDDNDNESGGSSSGGGGYEDASPPARRPKQSSAPAPDGADEDVLDDDVPF